MSYDLYPHPHKMAWLSEQLFSDHPIIFAFLLCPQVKILDAMQDIYYGRVASPWALDVDDWTIDPHQVNCTISSESDLRCKLRCSLEVHLVASNV